MTRDEAVAEAALILAEACVEADALPADEVAQRAHVPGGPTIAELVELVRAQRAAARGEAA